MCFGTYGTAVLKSITAPTNVRLVELLLGLILDNEIITNQNNEPYVITDRIASMLLSCKAPVHRDIQAVAASPKITDIANDYFSDVVIPEIIAVKKADLLSELCTLISEDRQISELTKIELLASADVNTLPEFLSKAMLYALSVPNKEASIKADMEAAAELSPSVADIAKLRDLLSKFKRPDDIPVPPEPMEDELKYITELLAAYAEASSVGSISRKDLFSYPQYEADFHQRRKEFYAAESIRRGTRDVFDQFDALKDETYNGIFDVHSGTFPHGYARLLSVMAVASTITINRCVLGQIPGWIGNGEKKGVCHILVNDGRIRWAVQDE